MREVAEHFLQSNGSTAWTPLQHQKRGSSRTPCLSWQLGSFKVTGP